MSTSSLLFSTFHNFYHSINLADFIAYYNSGGILARSLLEKTGLMTTFSTDAQDRDLDIYDKVFGNTYFIGYNFWRGNLKWTPCAYGPITIRFNPIIWKAYDLNSLTIGTITDPRHIDVDTNLFLEKVKQFGLPLHLEVSFGTDFLPFENYIDKIYIEPFYYNNDNIKDLIIKHIPNYKYSEITQLLRRNNPQAIRISDELIEACVKYKLTQRNPENIFAGNKHLKKYCSTLMRPKALVSWLQYFCEGTFSYW